MFIDTNFEIDTTVRATAILQDTIQLAQEAGVREVRTNHLLTVLLADAQVESFVGPIYLSEDQVESTGVLLRDAWSSRLAEAAARRGYEPQVPRADMLRPPYVGALLEQVLILARLEASTGPVEPEHLLLGLALEPTNVASVFLAEYGLTPERIREAQASDSLVLATD